MNSIARSTQAHILFTCGRELSYPRTALIFSILQDLGETRGAVSHSRHILLRYPSVMLQFLAHLARRSPDLLFVGFLGQPLVPAMRPFYRGPLLFDAFISLYDTLCFDRQSVAPHSFLGRLAYKLDQLSCQQADCILLDTQAHADYFQTTFNISADKFRVLPVSCDETIFFPRDGAIDPNLIVFVTSYLPLHALPVILEAARRLKNTAVHLQIIGDGPEKKHVMARATEEKLTNIQFVPAIPLKSMPDYLAPAQVVLGGHFGASEKAARVIPGKTYPALAMGKATIVGDNAANRELLTHGKDAWFCSMNDPSALADAIQTLIANPDLCAFLGRNARQTFLANASRAVLSEKLRMIIQTTLPDSTL